MMLNRGLVALLVNLILCSLPSIAWAQGGADAAVRRDLLEQAREQGRSGHPREALELAQRAGRVEMTPSLRLFIAQQQRALGLYAEASNNAELCAREAERGLASRNREELVSICRTLGEELRRQVGRVQVLVPATLPPGFQVQVAGNPLNEIFYGVGYIVTPGRVAIDATAPGFQPFRTFVEVTAGGSSQVAVQLLPAPNAPPTMQRETARFQLQPGALVLGSVGAAGLLTTAVLAALRAEAIDTLEKQCDAPDRLRCPNTMSVDTALQHASNLTIATNVSLGVSGALVAGGVTWLLAGGFARRNTAEHARTLRIHPSPTAVSIVFEGRF